MAPRMASCRVVSPTSPTGSMNGVESPCTGTARALCNTVDSFCRSPATKRVLMWAYRAGKIWMRAVRKG